MASFLLPFIGAGASALSRLFGGNQHTQDTSGSSSSTGQSNTSGSSSVAPSLTGLQQTIMNQLLGGAGAAASNDPSLTGYTSGAIQGNNQRSSAMKTLVKSLLASRGLAGSPTEASAVAGIDNSNFSNNTNTINQVPLMRQQLLQQNLSGLGTAFRSTPYGVNQNTTGTGITSQNTNSNSTTTGNSGSPLGDALGSFFGMGGGQGIQGLFKRSPLTDFSSQGLVP